ncbi:MAG TPA: sigma-70 family RNA polymerase sigma factor [Thermoanaerobaculia bacterium]|nr:sigma-70 family RNA polymerase sigma factor [Thermoanaerobaculia bacterium]
MEGDQAPKDLKLLSDAELVVRAQQGSVEQREDTIGELSERHGEVAFRSAMAILHNDDAARDAAQETLVRLLVRIDTLDASRSVRAWVAEVARNVALDRRRAGGRMILFCEVGDENVGAYADGKTPYDQLSHNQFLDAVKKLPLKQQVVVERTLLGDEVTDIARDLGLTKAAIYDRLNKAKNELRRILNPNHND